MPLYVVFFYCLSRLRIQLRVSGRAPFLPFSNAIGKEQYLQSVNSSSFEESRDLMKSRNFDVPVKGAREYSGFFKKKMLLWIYGCFEKVPKDFHSQKRCYCFLFIILWPRLQFERAGARQVEISRRQPGFWSLSFTHVLACVVVVPTTCAYPQGSLTENDEVAARVVTAKSRIYEEIS